MLWLCTVGNDSNHCQTIVNCFAHANHLHLIYNTFGHYPQLSNHLSRNMSTESVTVCFIVSFGRIRHEFVTLFLSSSLRQKTDHLCCSIVTVREERNASQVTYGSTGTLASQRFIRFFVSPPLRATIKWLQRRIRTTRIINTAVVRTHARLLASLAAPMH